MIGILMYLVWIGIVALIAWGSMLKADATKTKPFIPELYEKKIIISQPIYPLEIGKKSKQHQYQKVSV